MTPTKGETRRSSRIKRQRDEPSENNTVNSSHATPKRLCKNFHTSIEPIMSPARPDVPVPVRQVYQQMLPKNIDGIAFLFGSAFSDALREAAESGALIYRTTKEQALEEFRRFLAIKAFTVDEDATKISPTPLMDHLWHAAILDTKMYANLQAALGLALHHRPSGASPEESEPRARRLVIMNAIYITFFSTQPFRYFAPQPLRLPQRSPAQVFGLRQGVITVFVETATGKLIHLDISRQATVSDPKIRIQEAEGVPPDQQRFVYAGKQLEDIRTLQDYGIGNEAIIHLILRLSGC